MASVSPGPSFLRLLRVFHLPKDDTRVGDLFLDT